MHGGFSSQLSNTIYAHSLHKSECESNQRKIMSTSTPIIVFIGFETHLQIGRMIMHIFQVNLPMESMPVDELDILGHVQSKKRCAPFCYGFGLERHVSSKRCETGFEVHFSLVLWVCQRSRDQESN